MAGITSIGAVFFVFVAFVFCPVDAAAPVDQVFNLGGGIEIFDLCFIHKDCEAGVSFREGEYGPLPAWYCDDDRLLIPFLTPLDRCNIRVDCSLPAEPYFDENYQAWFCNDEPPPISPLLVLDPCFIHSRCGDPYKPEYRFDFAWFCNDKLISIEPEDRCFIHKDCSLPDLEPVYSIENQAWFCSDTITYDDCYVLPDCVEGLIYDNDVGAWFCNEEFVLNDPSFYDGQELAQCQIHSECDAGVGEAPYFNDDLQAWLCSVPAENPFDPEVFS